ncbi:MAG: hypothetical protein ACYTEO_19850 [Planctomycetota bacterium]|jgi:hypothetical protein
MIKWAMKIYYIADIGVIRVHRMAAENRGHMLDMRDEVIHNGFLVERMGSTFEAWICPSTLLRIECLGYEED